MNTDYFVHAMRYLSDDLLMEFLQMDEKLTAERTVARKKALKNAIAAACIALFVLLGGIILQKWPDKMPVSHKGLDSEAVSIFLNQEKYRMFGDSRHVRKLLAEQGLPADYGEETLGESLGYLEMTGSTIEGRMCFAFTEEITTNVLYSYESIDGNEFLVLRSEGHDYLLIKDGEAQ